MTDYDSRPETCEHIHMVQIMLAQVVDALMERMLTHDRSKLYDPELQTFDEVTPKLKDLTYGSDEYKAMLAEMGPALKHHYANNRHHPAHHVLGVEGMNLVDLLETVADWKAASMRHEDGDIRQSIEHEKGRFGISDQLHQILLNTLTYFGWDMKKGPMPRRTQRD